MNHLPFEEWLFNEEPLSHEDEDALNRHLEICDNCQNLQVAWSE